MFDYLKPFGWELKKKDKNEDQIRAPFVQKQQEDGSFVVGANQWGHNAYQFNLDQEFKTENALIEKYRSMAIHPEVDAAITEIVNEMVSGEIDEYPVQIVLDDIEGLSKNISDKITTEFKHILKLLDFNNQAYEIVKKWYVDGRLYYYMIPDKRADNGLVELRWMSPLHIKKIRHETHSPSAHAVTILEDVEEYYVYTPEQLDSQNKGIKLTEDAVCHVTSGNYDEKANKVYSYLHKAIRPINQLRMLEDATIIYRLARAPERRVIYVDIGNLPKGKADEYLKNIKASLTNKMVYDQSTGELKDQNENLSMMEDLFLPRKDGSRGTEVSSLPGGQNLGQIEDLEYFKRILYMSLNVPYGRLSVENQSPFTMGRVGEITREELNFSKFIQRIRKRFSKLFLELLRTHLLLRKIITKDDWEILEEGIKFDYVTDNYFKELKDAEILKERLALLSEADPYVGIYMSKDDVRRKILQMNDTDIEELEKQLQKEKEEEDPEDDIPDGEPPVPEDDGDGDDKSPEAKGVGFKIVPDNE